PEGVTAWATVIYAIAAFFTLWAIHGQSRHMRDAVIETRKAAEAAIRSAEVAERTLQLSQRAYLGLGTWEIDKFTLDQPPKLAGFFTQNTGHLPARIIQTCFHFSLVP